MQKMTPAQAWENFYVWIKSQPEWAGMERGDKQYLDKTNRHVNAGMAKSVRIRNALNKFAPGKYVFHEGEPFFTSNI